MRISEKRSDICSSDLKPPVFRQNTHTVSVIALALPAKPGHTMRQHAVQQIRRKIEPLKIFQSIHQPISGCRICANLELSQPYEARDATIHRILQQVSQILAQGWRDAMGDKIHDPAVGLNQRDRKSTRLNSTH